MDREQALKEYGLSDKEIAVYLALLPLGNTNLQQIARHLDFPRTTVYNTLNYLVEKGLAAKVLQGRVTYFAAVDPKVLITRIEQRKQTLLAALPQLQALKSTTKGSSRVAMYEGFRGLSTILSDVFERRQQTYYFGSYSKSMEILKFLPAHSRTLRLDRNIPARIIIEPSDEATFHTAAYKKITEIRFLTSLRDFPCMAFIYGSKVAIYTVEGELYGIIIENKEMAGAMRMIFDMYWRMAKPAKL